ncbi:cadherin-89D [Culex pipiens pallens]|uniref:cadherin-89D n=1 Tax=Culex pipiens pallens TaxID=42434 RepID=UPI00195375C6|nr:cadherin-89D [Culex pipiens pallens]
MLAGIILALVGACAGQQLLDSRCYLEQGGSAENFLASENVAVGAVLGTLGINGDPLRDISLSLREKDSPVTISEKKLILSKPLDKEGISGPSSVYVNVICDRRMSDDPSFLIPVNIRVIDENDNSPQWIGGPYSANVSEVTIVGTRILQGVRAVDLDQPGPYSTIEYQVLPGQHSHFVAFVSPLEGVLVLKQELDFETSRKFTVKLRAQDQGSPPRYSDTSFTIIVQDADDQNPKFSRDVYQSTYCGMPGEIDLHVQPEPIRAFDQDYGINASLTYSIVPSAVSTFFTIEPRKGTLRARDSNTTNGITLVIKATQNDNADRYALSTVIVSCPTAVPRTNIEPTTPRLVYRATVKENFPLGHSILNLGLNKEALNFKYTIVNEAERQWFSVDNKFNIILIKALDYESNRNHKFTVELFDNSKLLATAEIFIEVTDVNDWDPRFRKPQYVFTADNADQIQSPVLLGIVEAADGDPNDVLTYSIHGEEANLFSVDSRGGIWLKRNLTHKNALNLFLTASDSGSPPKRTTVPLQIRFPNAKSTTSAGWTPTIIGLLAIAVAILTLTVLALYIYRLFAKPKTTINTPLTNPRSTRHDATMIAPNSRDASSIADSDKGSSYSAIIRDIVIGAQQRSNIPGNLIGHMEDNNPMMADGHGVIQQSCAHPASQQVRDRSNSYWGNAEVVTVKDESDSENNLTVYF